MAQGVTSRYLNIFRIKTFTQTLGTSNDSRHSGSIRRRVNKKKRSYGNRLNPDRYYDSYERRRLLSPKYKYRCPVHPAQSRKGQEVVQSSRTQLQWPYAGASQLPLSFSLSYLFENLASLATNRRTRDQSINRPLAFSSLHLMH